MKRKVVVKKYSNSPDLVIKDSVIVKRYKDDYVNRMSFKNYFYTSLNPDLAPEGFLEELDRLLNLPRVTITTHGVSEFANYCAILKPYLENTK
ncbi:hypothetical protein vBAmePPT11V19_00051 [Alteromonas phage vB_AmeP_PT11-V19]|nr:hypothetical protein vBAmePPT11V19_00051 [Alteromonas phage vB_AmeP_PT11-V19]